MGERVCAIPKETMSSAAMGGANCLVITITVRTRQLLAICIAMLNVDPSMRRKN